MRKGSIQAPLDPEVLAVVGGDAGGGAQRQQVQHVDVEVELPADERHAG